MQRITVLGAGAMGSALTRPLVDAGWDVHLWGTWLDDHLIDAIEAGQPHPRINVVISNKVTTYRSEQLAEALEGADVVVMSVSSEGVPGVAKLALPLLGNAQALWMTSKGFCPDPDGNIQLLPDALRRIAGDRAVRLIREEPNETITRIVAGWPRNFDAKRALSLGFVAERDFDEILRAHVDDELGGRVGG